MRATARPSMRLRVPRWASGNPGSIDGGGGGVCCGSEQRRVNAGSRWLEGAEHEGSETPNNQSQSQAARYLRTVSTVQWDNKTPEVRVRVETSDVACTYQTLFISSNLTSFRPPCVQTNGPASAVEDQTCGPFAQSMDVSLAASIPARRVTATLGAQCHGGQTAGGFVAWRGRRRVYSQRCTAMSQGPRQRERHDERSRRI